MTRKKPEHGTQKHIKDRWILEPLPPERRDAYDAMWEMLIRKAQPYAIEHALAQIEAERDERERRAQHSGKSTPKRGKNRGVPYT